MPPKPKFTREEIVEAALDIVSGSGIEALTARELGVKLVSSARPLFTVFKRLGPTAQSCIDTICDTYGLTGAQARMLFENVWIYTFGVGALCATRVFSFSQQQLGQMLTTQFQSMMMLIKSGNYPSNGQGD